MEALQLLDTPKRLSLSAQSTALRVALKDWEKAFATSNAGRKPGKDDIKANLEIASKYKEYNKLRDVLAGRLAIGALDFPSSPAHSKTKSKQRRAAIAACLTTPSRRKYTYSPPRTSLHTQDGHPSRIDPYDAPASASPKPYSLSAIGPTPQRDGKVLGLFDSLSTPSKSSQLTPSGKKRKLEALNEADGNAGGAITQTPSRKVQKIAGDLFDHLDAADETPGRHKHSKTPVSEGKKFMLSRFFATPTISRFSSIVHGSGTTPGKVNATLQKATLLEPLSLEQDRSTVVAPDATPLYLKRSYSFKDRLMSASAAGSTKSNELQDMAFSDSASRRIPPPLRRHKSAPKLLSQIVQDLRKIEDGQHDDDLDALREMEGNEADVPVVNSRFTTSVQEAESHEDMRDQQPPRVWKKKGQKRTTRRSIMRPTLIQPKADPKFVAPDDGDSENEEDSPRSEPMQIGTGDTPADESEDELHGSKTVASSGRAAARDSGESDNDVAYSDIDQVDDERRSTTDRTSAPKEAPAKAAKSSRNKKPKPATAKKGTINPNAHSHMNFKTLKIRNRNSKANAGGGRFRGRGRR